MGRKVHPIGFRLKVNKTWEGRWYAEGQEYVDQLRQDIELRDMIREETQRAGVSRIEIERFPGKVKIMVHTAKPGILIGRKGENVKKLRADLEGLVGKKIDLDIPVRTQDQLPTCDEASHSAVNAPGSRRYSY